MFCQLDCEFESHPVHFLILFQIFEKLSSKIGVSSNLVWAQKTSYPTISAHSAVLKNTYHFSLLFWNGNVLLLMHGTVKGNKDLNSFFETLILKENKKVLNIHVKEQVQDKTELSDIFLFVKCVIRNHLKFV